MCIHTHSLYTAFVVCLFPPSSYLPTYHLAFSLSVCLSLPTVLHLTSYLPNYSFYSLSLFLPLSLSPTRFLCCSIHQLTSQFLSYVLTVSLSICLSIDQSIYNVISSIQSFVCLPIQLSVCPSVYPSVHFVCMLTCIHTRVLTYVFNYAYA